MEEEKKLCQNMAYLSLGTNLGDRKQNLENCISFIGKKVGTLTQQSSLYQTKAWGVPNQPDFWNMVLEVQTSLSPPLVLKTILAIEIEMGRVRERKWFTRLIDIDLLFYGDLIIETPNLIVPHPYLQERNFVLYPLVELAPLLVHPILQKTVQELVAECGDELAVEKLIDVK